MANNLSEVSEELQNVLKDHFSKAEVNTDSVKMEVLNLASNVSLENTTNNKRHEQVLAELQTIKGLSYVLPCENNFKEAFTTQI